jgi:antitoxin (DNA-binding transcriptional repressor) of toxin-antitoxin stability system
MFTPTELLRWWRIDLNHITGKELRYRQPHYLKQVKESGEPLLIYYARKPMAMIVPCPPNTPPLPMVKAMGKRCKHGLLVCVKCHKKEAWKY